MKQDTFPVAIIHRDFEGETMGIKYNPNFEWKYLHGMTPDEVALIKWCVRIISPKKTISDLVSQL